MSDLAREMPNVRIYTDSIRAQVQILSDEQSLEIFRPHILAGLDGLEQWSAAIFKRQGNLNGLLFLLGTCDCILLGALYCYLRRIESRNSK